MSYLGNRHGTGVTSMPGVTNPLLVGGWIVAFTPQVLAADADFEMWHGFVLGPGGKFVVYLDDAGYGVGQNGALNEYAPSGGAMYVRKGQSIYLFWSTTSTPAPNVWIYLRTPEVGK